MATTPLIPDHDSGREASLRGLAELAFGSFSRVTEFTQGRHLALLPAEALELDLNDPGQRQFGDYELLEHLGEGGMGVVYRARQISLQREVAVKLLSAGPWASRDFIARFEREAQNAARMQHPNIVTVYEVGSFEGLHFFSMQLVRGESLSARMRGGGRMAPRAAAALMRTIAEAVDYAHRLGVLHLDLKPANVLLDEQGRPYVADFGLARRLENALAVENNEVSGTPAYMAPEQAQVRAHKLTAATDIWGLGAILYELLTGHPPFRAETAQATVQLVLEGQVRAPRRWQPELPLDLEAIALRCLNRNPGERYPSARALADDLARYVEGRPVHARPLNAVQRMSRWTRREPKLATAAACAVAALVIGLLATTQQWRRAEASGATALQNLWATRAQTAQNALADGDGFHGLRPLVANLAEMEAAHRDRDAAIERQRIGTILANAPQLVDFLRLPAGEIATAIAIAPDGRHFAVATAHGEWGGAPHHVRQFELDTLRQTWSVLADHRTFLMSAGDAGAPLSGLRYTADGRFLLVSLIEQPVVPAPRTTDMIAFDARDGRVLWPEGLPRRQADIVYDDAVRLALVRFRSDASLRWPDSAQFYDVEHWRPTGPLHTRATTLAADLWLPAPENDAWLGTRDSARFALYEVPSLKPRWQLQLPQTSLVRAWQFSHDGRLLALGSVDGAVRIVDVANGHAVQLGSGPAERVLRVEFSPDGHALAAVDETGRLWTWDVASGLPLSTAFPFVRSTAGVRLRFTGHAVFGGGLLDTGSAQINYAAIMPRAPFNIATGRAPARPHGSNFGTAFDASHLACRLVMGAGDGMVEVWQLPLSPVLDARAAPLQSDVQTFDGVRVVAVDGEAVHVENAATLAPLSPPLRHPEPVRFAELSPDGRSLATIAGRTLRIIDANTWRLRGAPILLPQTPKRAVFAQAAPLLVLTTTDYVGGVLRERIHRVDLEKGALLEGPGFDALTGFALDAHGRYALLASWNSASHVEAGPRRVALDDGAVSCAPRIESPMAMTLAADGRSAWFAIGTPSGSQLQRWDLDACRRAAAAELPGVQAPVLQAHGDGVAVHRGGKEALILIGADGKREAAVGVAIPDAVHAFALSADGARAAFATRNSVQIIDAHQGRRLSAPLSGPIVAGDDGIARLAFSPDGTRLLARTINGRWMYLNLPRSELDSAVLGKLVRVLDPEPGQGLADADLSAVRKNLGTDPCPPLVPPTGGAPIAFAPLAGAGSDSRFVPLDLRAADNIPLVGSVWPEPYSRGDRPTLAPGLQRFLGVDYRVDGGVQLSGGGTATAMGPELHRSAVVAVPDIVARRVHVLAFMHTPMERGVPSRTFAHVVLIGAGGRETSLEIRTVRDVATDVIANRGAASARIAFSGVSSSFVRGGESTDPVSNVYEVALDVPQGTGPIRGLRFDVAEGPMEAPLFYAATLEREVSPQPAAVR